jgi:membrane-associated phospholipid phosphatase
MNDDAEDAVELALLLRLAAWSGEHALPVFCGALALLLAASALFWVGLLRYAGPPGKHRLSAPWDVFLRIGSGFVVIGGAAIVFTEIADDLTEQDLDSIDQTFMRSLAAHVAPATRELFQWLTRLGDTVTLAIIGVVVALLLLWRRHRWLALGWATTVAGGTAFNWLLKQYFQRARPVHDGLETAQGFSFPSGHSAGSVIVYGMLAYLAMRLLPARWHVPVALAVAALAGTIGASRLFLGVHYPSDVVSGFAVGIAWLGLCITSIEWGRLHRRRPND